FRQVVTLPATVNAFLDGAERLGQAEHLLTIRSQQVMRQALRGFRPDPRELAQLLDQPSNGSARPCSHHDCHQFAAGVARSSQRPGPNPGIPNPGGRPRVPAIFAVSSATCCLARSSAWFAAALMRSSSNSRSPLKASSLIVHETISRLPFARTLTMPPPA